MRVNKSLILTGAACVGVAGTAYLSFQAGRKYERGAKQFPPAHSKTLLLPPIVIGGLTITAIILNQRFNAKTIMGLTASAGYIALNRDEVERQIEEKYGKDALKELKQKATAILNQERVIAVSAEETGYGDTLVINEYDGRIFRSSYDAVCKGIAEFCDLHDSGVSVSLNNLYDKWGLVPTTFGSKLGFPDNDVYYPDPLCIEANYIHKEDVLPWNDYAKFEEDFIVVEWYSYPMEGWDEV